MRRVLPLLLALGILAAFVGTLWFLWSRAQVPETERVTEQAEVRDIVLRTVATGSVVPRREIAVKSSVSGVIRSLEVEAGESLAIDELIATIRIVPDAEALARAEASVGQARIAESQARREYERVKTLVERGGAAKAELDVLRDQRNAATSELSSARKLLQIVRDGASGSGEVATDVRTTVGGMVLDVPVEVGASVIEANTFNEGTTIAFVADMDDMIFEGRVDESEVGRIAEGMALEISIGALQDLTLTGSLEHVAPKGVDEDGAVQFPIRAAIALPEGVFVRAGLSANADIVLDKRDDVLAVREALLTYDGPNASVDVVDGESTRTVGVSLGLSDGIWAEVLDGITSDDVLVVPEGSGAPARRR